MKTMARLLALALALSGCGAGFGDTHPRSDGGTDGGGDDLALGADRDLAGAPPADLFGVPPADLAGAQTLASGTFVKGQQNGGDTGSGSAILQRNAGGGESVIFGADFQSSPVPAGEVVLTARSAIGTGGLVAGDLDLGALQSSKGTQQYTLPADDGGRRNLFVYCVTYGIDVAVAKLQ